VAKDAAKGFDIFCLLVVLSGVGMSIMWSEIQMLKRSMKSVLRELEYQKYSKSTIDTYSIIYNGILKHMQANKISSFNEKVCIKYVFFWTGYKIDGFYGAGNPKLNTVMKPLQVLLDYIQTGTVKFKMRPKIRPYQCPARFEEEYLSFSGRTYIQGLCQINRYQ